MNGVVSDMKSVTKTIIKAWEKGNKASEGRK
jgi:hypothetical protein